MRQITQEQINSFAPNASAINNAKKISNGNGFVSRFCSSDDSFYMGECKGSGKSNYSTSVDFVDESNPVFRCSCPSRQFPCKHSLALLFEMMNEKPFEVGAIPQDILDKRAKKEARETKKQEASSVEKKVKTKKSNQTARIKKINKQLEGLQLLEKMIMTFLQSGLGSMGGVSLKSYRDLAKQLGDYYLPAPLNYMNRLILEIEAYQKDSDAIHYENAVNILVRMRSLTKKAKAYLNEKLETQNLEDDENILYEELGGIWSLERLNQLGRYKENARLVQLSFVTYLDEARKEWVDLGYFADLDSGEIHVTYHYRPVKALKYIKEESSQFSLVRVPCLTYYPGDANKRIRWEGERLEPMNDAIRRELMQKAETDLLRVTKQVKNQIKNTLSDDKVAILFAFSQIAKHKESGEIMLVDSFGNRIALRDKRGNEPTMEQFLSLPARNLFVNQVLFGMLYYDWNDHQMCIQPYSIVTEQAIVRLLY